MTGERPTDDVEYWTRNVRARLEQSNDYDAEEFILSPAPDNSPESAVVLGQRDNDSTDWGEQQWTRFITMLKRGGFEVYTNGRPVTGFYVAEREPLEYPYAEEDSGQ